MLTAADHGSSNDYMFLIKIDVRSSWKGSEYELNTFSKEKLTNKIEFKLKSS